MSKKDNQIAGHMIRHCEEIIVALKRFGFSKEQFINDFVFYNSCCMSLFQVGELSKRLSDDFRNGNL